MVGGSIRSPAANNGVYGLRPTSHRLPVLGATVPIIGGINIAATFGPLSTSLEGINLFMKTILAAKPWLIEPSLVPIPWRDQSPVPEDSHGRRLKVGIMWHDEVVTPHPSVTRALSEVVSSLQSRVDVEVGKWKPYNHALGWEIIVRWSWS